MLGPDQLSAHYDVIVVGAGPAGISAAINVANRKRSVLVLDSQTPFAKTKRAPTIPNYPGFAFTTGEELAAAFVAHMERFDVPFSKERVSKVMPSEDEVLVFTDREMYHARAVILATGVHREVDLEGEEELIGRGVSYCANCDGRLFAGKRVVYISYIPDGEEEAAVLHEDLGVDVTYLPLYAGTPSLPSDVRVLPRERPERLRAHDGAIFVDLASGPLRVDGVFVHKASVAPDALVEGIQVDDRHIVVGRDLAVGPPGLFAAGDCTGEPYQIAKAVGEGQVAALRALAYLRKSPAAPPESAQPPAVVATPEPLEPAEPPALKREDRENLTRILGERLSSPVRLVHFGQSGEEHGEPVPMCEACREARRLVEEFASLDERIAFESHDFGHEADLAARMGVTKIPATLVVGADGAAARVRFYGTPSGYEFGALLDAVVAASSGTSRLTEDTRATLAEETGGAERPVHIEVLTTPTCPKCPEVVKLAHAFALATPTVTADMIAVNEFPEVARLHQVMTVPQVLVDGRALGAGRFDEARLLQAVVSAARGEEVG